MGFLDELVADGSLPSGMRQQIRDAYPDLLEDYKRREAAGERFAFTDLIAYQFLLGRGGAARNPPTHRVENPPPRPQTPGPHGGISGTSQAAVSLQVKDQGHREPFFIVS